MVKVKTYHDNIYDITREIMSEINKDLKWYMKEGYLDYKEDHDSEGNISIFIEDWESPISILIRRYIVRRPHLTFEDIHVPLDDPNCFERVKQKIEEMI